MANLARAARQTFQAFVGSFCLTLAVVGLLVLAWYVRGGRMLSVQTGSMLPLIRPGDLVLVSPLRGAALRPGDVVSYHSASSPKDSITHRVVEIDAHGTLTTKGDNASEADAPISQARVIGRVRWLVPGLGHLVDAMRHPIWFVGGCYVLMAAILLAELRQFVQHYGHYYRLKI